MSKLLFRLTFFIFAASLPGLASAQMRIDVSGVGANQVPIAIANFGGQGKPQPAVDSVIRSDLARSGMFRIIDINEPLTETSALDLAVFSHAQERKQHHLRDDEQQRKQQQASSPAPPPDSSPDGSVGFHAADSITSVPWVDPHSRRTHWRVSRPNTHSRRCAARSSHVIARDRLSERVLSDSRLCEVQLIARMRR